MLSGSDRYRFATQTDTLSGVFSASDRRTAKIALDSWSPCPPQAVTRTAKQAPTPHMRPVISASHPICSQHWPITFPASEPAKYPRLSRVQLSSSCTFARHHTLAAAGFTGAANGRAGGSRSVLRRACMRLSPPPPTVTLSGLLRAPQARRVRQHRLPTATPAELCLCRPNGASTQHQ
jgi:hypothetical protein